MKIARSTFRSMLALLVVSGLIFGVTSCFKAIQDHAFPSPKKLALQSTVVSNLKSPIGIVEDTKGYLWITEAGSGTASPASGQVSVITPSGSIFPVITGFVSAQSPEGGPEGLNHLALKDGKLYILHGVTDRLYIADVSSFVPGVTAPLSASALASEDIGTYVKGEHPNAPDDPDSNPYNLIFGPDGDLYIADAGANAIIRRNKDTKALSIYATFPDITTSPKPFSGDVVPTGIVFDGTKFWVTSLTGAPFHPNIATIYHVTYGGATGVVSSYKTGFTTLTDIELSPDKKPLVTEFGFQAAGPPILGLVASGDDPNETLLDLTGSNPVDILRSNAADTYYIVLTSATDGKVIKVIATL
ncbi:ScyD/ScyE family protein [Larkinella bovis]|uniref:ScyD/ScyE family protein n=1 Tax=Larkinella bovis TaxID=683041 RepID=A0ABW0IEG2_9BACT